MSVLLRIPRFALAALAGSLTYFTYSFMEPILAIRLNDFSLSSLSRGLFFAVLPCFYIPASLMIQYVPSKVEKRAIIISSMAGLFVAFLFVGPSLVSALDDAKVMQVFGLPQTIYLMVLGQAMVGLLSPFMLIPILPEMVEAAALEHPQQREAINDLSAGIFNAFLGLGQLCAPIFGSLMFDRVGFRATSDTVAFICLASAAVYVAKGDGITALRNSLARQEEDDTVEDFIKI